MSSITRTSGILAAVVVATVVSGTVDVVMVGGAVGCEVKYTPAMITTMRTAITIAALVVVIAFL